MSLNEKIDVASQILYEIAVYSENPKKDISNYLRGFLYGILSQRRKETSYDAIEKEGGRAALPLDV